MLLCNGSGWHGLYCSMSGCAFGFLAPLGRRRSFNDNDCHPAAISLPWALRNDLGVSKRAQRRGRSAVQSICRKARFEFVNSLLN